jgi:hypothetical protein
MEHPDYENLVNASKAIDIVADEINEVKRRKDIVEKYVHGKGQVNVM